MKLTIEISDAEAKGLRDYLREVGEMKGTKAEIIAHVENIVTGIINAPQEASSNYIRKYVWNEMAERLGKRIPF